MVVLYWSIYLWFPLLLVTGQVILYKNRLEKYSMIMQRMTNRKASGPYGFSTDFNKEFQNIPVNNIPQNVQESKENGNHFHPI